MSLEMKVPTVGEAITEVTLAQWLKNDGDYADMDEIVAEGESDKTTFELTGENAGILRQVAGEGDTLEIGAVVCTIEDGAKQEGAAPSKDESTSEAKPESTSSKDALESQETYAAGTPSPAAAKILKERGIDAKNINGTGKDGRITKEDALNASDKPSAAPKEKVGAQVSESPSASEPVAGARNERREKMSSLRKTIAKRLVTVKNETAMLTTCNEVDMKPIMDLRTKYKDKFKEKHGIGLGFMSF